MNVEFWQSIQRQQIVAFSMLFVLALFLAAAAHVAYLRLRTKENANWKAEFSTLRENRQFNRLRNALALGLMSLLCLTLSIVQVVAIFRLHADIRQELPVASTSGIVRSELSPLCGNTYIFLNDSVYLYTNDISGAAPQKGETYEIEYLVHSKWIVRVNEN